MPKKRNALVLYSRLPLKNKSGKTRLGKEIDNMEVASDFSELMILSLINEYQPKARDTYDLLFYYKGDLDKFTQKGLFRVKEYIEQHSDSLTLKKIHKQVAHTYEKVIIVGSDIPLISKKTIQKAFAQLEEHSVVIAPVEDGGYGLIGSKKFYDLYSKISNWDSRSKGYALTKETLQITKMNNLSAYLFKESFDIDYKADVQKLWRQITSNHQLKKEYVYLFKLYQYLIEQKKIFKIS